MTKAAENNTSFGATTLLSGKAVFTWRIKYDVSRVLWPVWTQRLFTDSIFISLSDAELQKY